MNFSINLNDLEESTKIIILKDPGCSPDIFSELARNGSENIKIHCARDIKCPTEIIHQLVKEGDKSFKEHKEKKGNLMLNCNWGYIIMKACSFNPNCDTQTVMDILDVIPEIINNPAIGEKTLREFYEKEKEKQQSSVGEVLRGIASNPNCPEDLLIEIARTTKNYDRFSGVGYLESDIARNKNTPPEVLVELSRYPDTGNYNFEDIRRAIGSNKNSPIPLLEFIFMNSYDYETSDQCRETLNILKIELGEEGFEKTKRIQEILYLKKYFI